MRIDLRAERARMKLLGLQVQDEDCAWRGRNDCRPWLRMMYALGAAVVVDLAAGIANVFMGNTMEHSRLKHIRRCASTMRRVHSSSQTVAAVVASIPQFHIEHSHAPSMCMARAQSTSRFGDNFAFALPSCRASATSLHSGTLNECRMQP